MLSIIIGSLIPHGMRIPGYHGPSKLVHFVAYFIVSISAAFIVNSRTELIIYLVCIVIISGLIEIAQYYIPGRYASVTDFIVNILGVTTAGVIIMLWHTL